MTHIERRGKGRYRARYRAPDGNERSQTFTHKRAENFLATQTVAKEVGAWIDPCRARMTVGYWADRWLAGRVHLKPNTLAGYDSLLRTRIRPTWAKVQLRSVTNADVIACASGLSPVLVDARCCCSRSETRDEPSGRCRPAADGED
jgi:hypothetical protein